MEMLEAAFCTIYLMLLEGMNGGTDTKVILIRAIGQLIKDCIQFNRQARAKRITCVIAQNRPAKE